MNQEPFSLGSIATLACLMEVAAPKPGNVSRNCDFEGTNFFDFQLSAVLLGNILDRHTHDSLGELVLKTIRANQNTVGQNTNLGIVLLICPLALSVSQQRISQESVAKTLSALTAEDCKSVYEAIKIAAPGGLGKVDKADVQGVAHPTDLIEAMRLAEDRDMVARQYANNFGNIFNDVIPILADSLERMETSSHGIVLAHVNLMARFPDSLIERKCGSQVARHAQMLAEKVVNSSNGLMDHDRLSELDFYLRSDGNRRNPGTTADLIAAGLFVMLANEMIDFQRPFF